MFNCRISVPLSSPPLSRIRTAIWAMLDGKEYTIPVNCGPNHLHGGPQGFANQVWESRIEGDAVEFMYFSEDGEAGFPGNLKAVAHYEWSEENELKLILATAPARS